ncbi:hypothetical protein [Novosphingobium pentaromativorans]|uniref:hypothetical protein n=1 Tax=Novosphingobium pentaromativorans TaxID=205844 RepID=UPI00051F76A6|nr:hypothetical protein [Novosphingobium pentaromativorans]AIT81246.1 hypothetical protein JI59_16400 [Novosphingobium pentaromativorans US6-1]
MNAAQFGLAILGWVFGAFGGIWIVSAIVSPIWFANTLSFARITNGRRRLHYAHSIERWWHYPVGLLMLCAIGRVLYCATYAITFIIPPNLGVADDAGDWASARFSIQLLITVLLTVTLAPCLENRALADEERHRQPDIAR